MRYVLINHDYNRIQAGWIAMSKFIQDTGTSGITEINRVIRYYWKSSNNSNSDPNDQTLLAFQMAQILSQYINFISRFSQCIYMFMHTGSHKCVAYWRGCVWMWVCVRKRQTEILFCFAYILLIFWSIHLLRSVGSDQRTFELPKSQRDL